jgi:hypothetical protein
MRMCLCAEECFHRIARDFSRDEAVHRVIPDKPRDYKCNSHANSVSGNIRVLLPRPDEAFRGRKRKRENGRSRSVKPCLIGGAWSRLDRRRANRHLSFLLSRPPLFLSLSLSLCVRVIRMLHQRAAHGADRIADRNNERSKNRIGE